MFAENINEATLLDFQPECRTPLLTHFYCSNSEVQFIIGSPVSRLVDGWYGCCSILPVDLCRIGWMVNIVVYLITGHTYTGNIYILEIHRHGGVYTCSIFQVCGDRLIHIYNICWLSLVICPVCPICEDSTFCEDAERFSSSWGDIISKRNRIYFNTAVFCVYRHILFWELACSRQTAKGHVIIGKITIIICTMPTTICIAGSSCKRIAVPVVVSIWKQDDCLYGVWSATRRINFLNRFINCRPHGGTWIGNHWINFCFDLFLIETQ